MLTLREAYQDYVDGRRHELSPRSIEWMDQKVETHMVDLLDRPLEEITPRTCRALHEALSRNSGRYSSNGALRVLKAVWNDAARTYDLPPNPVSRGVRMNREYPAELTITLDDLPKLWLDLEAIEDPIKRTCWLALMMTGLRSHDARSMRWDQIDGDGILHLPNPKGGKAKAFDLPLCGHLLDRLGDLDRRSDYVFPSRRPYLTELRRTPEFDHNPHSFRRLYRTLCVEAEVDFTTSKLLLNHSMASDISFRYVSRAQLLGPMKQAAEKVAKLLLSYRGKA